MLRKRLHSNWKERGCAERELRDGVQVDDLVKLSAERNSARPTPYLDLWLVALDEFISWEISFLLLVYTPFLKRRATKPTDFDKAVFTVLMRIVGDSLAIRHLILTGFDIAARTVLRSTAEYMEFLVALLADPSLSIEFVAADGPDDAKRFWERHLRGKRMRVRIRNAWRAFFKDDKSPTALWFADWGSGTYELLGGLSHPSYAGGVFTAVPFKTVYPEENWLGLWGDRSETSVDTIQYYSRFLLPILLLNDCPFRREYPSRLRTRFSGKNEFHRHVRHGRGVLASLVISLSSEDNRDYVTPKFDFSIWKKNTEGARD